MRLLTVAFGPFRIVIAIVEFLLEMVVEGIASALAPPARRGASDQSAPLPPRAKGIVHRVAVVIGSAVTAAALVLAAGWSAFPLVRYATQSESEATRARAVGWLEPWLPAHSVFHRELEAYAALVRVATHDESAAVRARAIGLLSERDVWPWEALPHLSDALMDPSPEIRERTLDAMVSCAERAQDPGRAYGTILTLLPEFDPADPRVEEFASPLAARLSREGLVSALTVQRADRATRWGFAILAAADDEECAAAALDAVDHLDAVVREAEQRERERSDDPSAAIQAWTESVDAYYRIWQIVCSLELLDTPACQAAAARARETHPGVGHSIRGLQLYLAEHPDAAGAGAASRRLVELPQDDGPFLAACADGTLEALRTFLEDYPGHRRWSEARRLAREALGEDVLELAAQGRLEIEVQGKDISSVTVRLRRLVPDVLEVRVPVGTLMVCDDASAQDMVVTGDVPVTLDRDEWIEVEAPAACANRSRRIPDSDERFRVTRAPSSEELERLMPVLDDAGVPSGVHQAAVWIVTDDADYGELGVLVLRLPHQTFGGTRVIEEPEAARAMQICAAAGIDLRTKAIWNDRERILGGLEPGELCDWLAALR